jgi:RNA polymerase sigma factor (sigma-70 family)
MNKYADSLNFSINKSGSTDAYINEGQINEIFRVVGEQLSPTEARVIALRYIKGCNIKEIAKKMNVKKETVSRYICRGLQKIRQFLKKQNGGNQNDQIQ